MSVILSFKFLTGHYRATPWDKQVNEGCVEWPPSPWRILRALVAAAYKMQACEPEEMPVEGVTPIVAKLSECLPSYALPPWTEGHTRHYMPIINDKKKPTTTKVFDTFLALAGDATVIVAWEDVGLDAGEMSLLRRLCAFIPYLGRAESWVEVGVASDAPRRYSAVPAAEGSGGELVRVLVPLTPVELGEFKAKVGAKQKQKVGGKPKGKRKGEVDLPANVREALELNIGDFHEQGWSGIPGAKWVRYRLFAGEGAVGLEARNRRGKLPGAGHLPDAEAGTPMPSAPAGRGSEREFSMGGKSFNYLSSVQRQVPNMARFALSSNVLPRLREALSVGERLHQSLVKCSEKEDGTVSAVFSGCDERGEALKSDHRHAWYLPEVNEGGWIECVTIYARGGFAGGDLMALQGLRRIWGRSLDIQLVLVALGQADDYRASIPGEVGGRSLVLGRGKVWRSLTPVVLSRHPKRRRTGEPKIDPVTGLWADGPEHQVRRGLQQLGLPEPVAVRELEGGSWYNFQRRRYSGEGSKGPNRPYGFEIVFAEAQEGPVALGYAAHFGLGLFVPVG